MYQEGYDHYIILLKKKKFFMYQCKDITLLHRDTQGKRKNAFY